MGLMINHTLIMEDMNRDLIETQSDICPRLLHSEYSESYIGPRVLILQAPRIAYGAVIRLNTVYIRFKSNPMHPRSSIIRLNRHYVRSNVTLTAYAASSRLRGLPGAGGVLRTSIFVTKWRV
jgi:hypothetical protein